MGLHIVHLAAVPPQPWRNGGGQTRELLAWPPGSGSGWQVRVSVADIERDGPFSAFPGVQRGFVVLEGAGVVLGLADSQCTLTPASPPLQFDGDDAPACRLVAGPTRDLNLMALASAGAARIEAVVDDAALAPVPGARWRGVYTATPMRLAAGSGLAIDLGAGSLAWSDAPDTLAATWHPSGRQQLPLRAWSMALAGAAGAQARAR
jgi:environmental stress-induced protein Ves